MTRFISKIRGLMLVAALAILLVPVAAYAQDGMEMEKKGSPSTTQMNVTAPDRNTVKTTADTPRVSAVKARLEAAQLNRCKAKEKVITSIMARIGDRGQRQIDLFATIAERVKAFYGEKGYTLDNYDTLVAQVDAKKAAAQAVVSDIKGAGTSFTCGGDNPRGVIDGFKASFQQEVAALREYKTAVKNLIVGVKSARSSGTADSTAAGGE